MPTNYSVTSWKYGCGQPVVGISPLPTIHHYQVLDKKHPLEMKIMNDQCVYFGFFSWVAHSKEYFFWGEELSELFMRLGIFFSAEPERSPQPIETFSPCSRMGPRNSKTSTIPCLNGSSHVMDFSHNAINRTQRTPSSHFMSSRLHLSASHGIEVSETIEDRGPSQRVDRSMVSSGLSGAGVGSGKPWWARGRGGYTVGVIDHWWSTIN